MLYRAQTAAESIFGNIRRQLGRVFHARAKQKECQMVEGHLMPDHVHLEMANKQVDQMQLKLASS